MVGQPTGLDGVGGCGGAVQDGVSLHRCWAVLHAIYHSCAIINGA
jgi:hypothetical protein